MVGLRRYDNDQLIRYLLNVLEMINQPMLEEKALKKLKSLFGIGEIIQPEEKKVNINALSMQPIKQKRGIHSSTIL